MKFELIEARGTVQGAVNLENLGKDWNSPAEITARKP
jgi:hypothetical protein